AGVGLEGCAVVMEVPIDGTVVGGPGEVENLAREGGGLVLVDRLVIAGVDHEFRIIRNGYVNGRETGEAVGIDLYRNGVDAWTDKGVFGRKSAGGTGQEIDAVVIEV